MHMTLRQKQVLLHANLALKKRVSSGTVMTTRVTVRQINCESPRPARKIQKESRMDKMFHQDSRVTIARRHTTAPLVYFYVKSHHDMRICASLATTSRCGVAINSRPHCASVHGSCATLTVVTNEEATLMLLTWPTFSFRNLASYSYTVAQLAKLTSHYCVNRARPLQLQPRARYL